MAQFGSLFAAIVKFSLRRLACFFPQHTKPPPFHLAGNLPLHPRTHFVSPSPRVRGPDGVSCHGGHRAMTLFGMKKKLRKRLHGVLIAVLTLTLLPAQGRCQDTDSLSKIFQPSGQKKPAPSRPTKPACSED